MNYFRALYMSALDGDTDAYTLLLLWFSYLLFIATFILIRHQRRINRLFSTLTDTKGLLFSGLLRVQDNMKKAAWSTEEYTKRKKAKGELNLAETEFTGKIRQYCTRAAKEADSLVNVVEKEIEKSFKKK
jgi:hypothetical protein